MALSRQAIPGAAWMLAPGDAWLQHQYRCRAQPRGATKRHKSMPRQIAVRGSLSYSMDIERSLPYAERQPPLLKDF